MTTFEAHIFVNDGVANAFAEILGAGGDGLAKISIPKKEVEGNFFAPLNNSAKIQTATPGLAKPRKASFEIKYTRALTDRLNALIGVEKSFRVEEPAAEGNAATRLEFDGYIDAIDDDLEKGKQRFLKVSIQMKADVTTTTPS